MKDGTSKKLNANLRAVYYDRVRHSPQNVREELTDLYFILLVLRGAELMGKQVTRINLVKTLFQTKLDLAKKGKDFFFTDFYIYNYGPFNKNLYSYLSRLEEAKLIDIEGNVVSLTTPGFNKLDPLVEEFNKVEENSIDIYRSFENNLQKFDTYTKAVEKTHSLKIIDTTDGGKVKTIHDIAEQVGEVGKRLLYIEPLEELKSRFELRTHVINEIATLIAGVEKEDYDRPPQKVDVMALYSSV